MSALPTTESHLRLAEWHASRVLLLQRAGKHDAARGHFDSAKEWLEIAGVKCRHVLDATEIHGLCALARTGSFE